MIWIVDFGSQYTQLITRKMRELEFKSEILTPEVALDKIQTSRPHALILSGGPQSVFEDQTDYKAFFADQTLPVLGICYGMQIIGQTFGGVVEKGIQGEYGKAQIKRVFDCSLPLSTQVWMSHADHVSELPGNFKKIYVSENGLCAGMIHEQRPIMTLQFHPEVAHTESGDEILVYFLKDVAHLKSDWKSAQIKESCLAELESVRGKNVLCAFSGGVDSLVAAYLTHQVIGKNLYCFFVDNGLLRPQDLHHIKLLQEKMPLQIEVIDAKKEFLGNLSGISDPEKKRKMIGSTFIDIFEKKVHEFETQKGIKFDYLLQGTLYPDVIESISPHIKGGKSVTIKSHHNVGGLPDRMKLKLVEPLRYLFKDEVRKLGAELSLPSEWLYRHPFPGPGIGVRVLGELSETAIKKVQHSDQILFEELKNFGVYDATWQAFTVLIPQKTVGVKGDGRVFEEIIALRLVNSRDGMTADVTEMPWNFLHQVSSRICNEVAGITRVVYDLTSKPPGTIEWE